MLRTEKESDLQDDNIERWICIQCNESDGSIFMCGEGYICEGCYSELADIPLCDLMMAESVTQESKDKVREGLTSGNDE